MATSTSSRSHLLRRALNLEYASLAYNVLEAVVGMILGLAAGSVALVGFALDSVVESSSASILIWRFRSERGSRRSSEELERRAVRLVAAAFFVLAAYVGVRSTYDLVTSARPDESVPGMVLAAVSVVVMPALAWRKRMVARDLDSRSLQADSKQTSLCAYLSLFLLLGLGSNALFGWWWADPLAGLAIAAVAADEGRELWTTEDFCCP
jgi:divalent metal cation (Fe/Co/Zn/Cd) transporter